MCAGKCADPEQHAPLFERGQQRSRQRYVRVLVRHFAAKCLSGFNQHLGKHGRPGRGRSTRPHAAWECLPETCREIQVLCAVPMQSSSRLSHTMWNRHISVTRRDLRRFSCMFALETSKATEYYPELCLFDVDGAVERLIRRGLFSTPDDEWDNVATKLRCMLCKLCPFAVGTFLP